MTNTDQLKSIIERYEALEHEVESLKGDQKDILTEAKKGGFNTKAIRAVIRRRKKDREELKRVEEVADQYEVACGFV